MKWTRRRLLASVLTAALVASTRPSVAFIASSPNATANFVTSITLQETAGNTIAANFVTPMFGLTFPQGVIPSGTTPKFQLAGGVPIPFSMELKPSLHADGSLRRSAFMLRPPSGVAANGSLTVQVLSGGTAPSASSRSTADFAAGGLDLNVTVVGLDNLSGTWVSNLNQGVGAAHSDDYQYMDGDAGAVWRIRASFRQSGADEGLLEGYWYCASLQNSSNGQYGYRHLTRISMPWQESASKVFKSFSSFLLQNGASTLVDLWGSHGNGQAFSWSVGSTFNCATNTNETGFLVRATTTGTLPSGLSLNTSYFQQKKSSTTIGFGTNSAGVTQGGSLLSATDNGSGTHTVTAYPYLTPFGSLFSATTSGTWNYTQGSGSQASDATVRVVFDKAYLRRTKAFPSYDLTINPTSSASTSYFPNTAGPVERNTDNTSERRDIGIMPSWYVKHFMTQAAVDELNVRVIALVGGAFPINIRNKNTNPGTLPCVNNGHGGSGSTYSGMNAPAPTMRYDATTNFSGMPAPTNTSVLLAGFHGADANHRCAFHYYALLTFGEPQYLDMMMEWANFSVLSLFNVTANTTIDASHYALASGGGRNITTSGTTRYGMVIGTAEQRGDGWALRDLCVAAAMVPPTDVHYQYFNDLIADHGGLIAAVRALAPTSFTTTTGLWYMQNNSYWVDVWMMGYAMQAMALSYAINGDSNMLAGLNDCIKWWSYVVDNWGGYFMAAEQILTRQNGVSNGPQIIDNLIIADLGPNFTSWTSGNPNFNMVPGGAYGDWVPHIDDLIVFTSPNPPSVVSTPIPGNFSAFTPYYIVSVSGTNPYVVQLAATKGGAAIVPNTNSSNSIQAWFRSDNLPATSSYSALTDTGYLTNMLGTMKYAQAVGATIDAGAIADLQGRFNAAGISFTSDPKWAFAAAF